MLKLLIRVSLQMPDRITNLSLVYNIGAGQFLRRNDPDLPIYDPTTGGCRDGLHPDRPNENQGAESTFTLLQAVLELRLAENNLLSTEAQSQ
jgi:hypothetical protein